MRLLVGDWTSLFIILDFVPRTPWEDCGFWNGNGQSEKEYLDEETSSRPRTVQRTPSEDHMDRDLVELILQKCHQDPYSLYVKKTLIIKLLRSIYKIDHI